MLTLQILKDMEPGVFAKGEMEDTHFGLNMTTSGRMLKWIAIRGSGIPDWTIYCHFAEHSWEFIRGQGDKVCREDHIKRLVACDDEAFKMYRL